ncbi:MAG: alpha/beta hydrolase [Spirochaetales bacterium]|nr:alpha/beta hydrolase [Spirochaetales bacterium]
MKRLLRIVLFGTLGLLVLSGGGFVLWALQALGPGPQAIESLQSDSDITIETNDQNWVLFRPNREQSDLPGFIFYPGGKVDYRSYAPVLRKIAQEGIFVVLVPAPLNLMILGSNRAQKVIDAFPDRSWVIGGHSLGAAVAGFFGYNNPELLNDGPIKGLVLWAGYLSSGWDLSTTTLPVLSIRAENDQVFNQENFEAGQALLPRGWVDREIAGGNHAGFGDYGPQPGDGQASIPQEEQWTVIAGWTAEFFQNLGP